MLKTVSLSGTIEKNKLSSDVVYLVCLDIEIPDQYGNVLERMHIVNNTEAITYKGNQYTPIRFDLEVRSESGTQPQVSVTITDYTRAVIEKMNQYGGGVGFRTTLFVVRSNALTEEPDVEEYFEVTTASAANYTVSFTLGAENPLTMRLPRRTQMRSFCNWIFKDPSTCRYAGASTNCDRTLNGALGCRYHNNIKNFGGFPGIISSGTMYR